VSAIRPAAPRELDRVCALWTQLLAEHAATPSLRAARSPEPALRAHLAALAAAEDGALLVAERGGDLEGFAALRVVRRPPLFAETRRGEIEALFVRREARRRGIGRELAEASLGWMAERGLARAAIQVAAENAPAQAFWRALGFRDTLDVLERPL
jgi:ribosomal-protein-alanine N-acetyltransferase